MDKAVPPTEVSDLPNRSRKKKTFFPKFIEKNSLQDRHTCVFGTISVFLVQRIHALFIFSNTRLNNSCLRWFKSVATEMFGQGFFFKNLLRTSVGLFNV